MVHEVKELMAKVAIARVIPVMVLDDIALAQPLAEALVRGGLNVLEVTLRTPNALEIIAVMARVKGAIVGSGTVRNAKQMRQSQDAGCRFMVSPGAPLKLLEEAEQFDIPLLPGVATPSEAMAAAEMGYSFLKFFPAEAAGGAKLLKSLASPLPELSFCPTGGINPAIAADYLSLPNVICVGGSWITPPGAVAGKDYDHIEKLAREASRIGL